jgi:hypothetical protein
VRLALVALTLALVACAPAVVAPSSVAPTAPDRAFAITRSNAPSLLASGEARLVSLTLRNVGNVPWQADGRLMYSWDGSPAPIRGDVTPLPTAVSPGASVDVVVALAAPTATGRYSLSWTLSDSAGTFEPRGDAARASVEVREPDARASWTDVTPAERFYADVVATVSATLTNAGTVAWPSKGPGAVALSYHWRGQSGRLVAWDGVRTALAGDLVPGESGGQSLRVAAPSAPGRYVLELDALREGVGWFGGGPRLTIDVAPSSYAASLAVVSAPSRVTVGMPIDVRIALKNNGAAPWPNAGERRTKLSYHVANADSKFVLWDGPRTELGQAAAPGQSLEVAATVRAPETPGRYKLRFDLVQDGVTWFERRGNLPLDVSIEVVTLDYKAFVAPPQTVPTMATGLTYTLRPTIVNVGQATWPRSGFEPVRIGAHWLDARGAVVNWDASRAELEKDVAPRDSITLPLDVTAPERPGTYTLVVDVVQEGIVWFADRGTLPAKVSVTVMPPTFRASLQGAVPSQLHAGEITSAQLTVRNDGPFAWPIEGDHPVRIAHHWRDENGDLVVWDGFRTELPNVLAPGDSLQLPVWFFAPGRPGTYTLEIDVVQEDITWFAQKGSTLLRASVEVVP